MPETAKTKVRSARFPEDLPDLQRLCWAYRDHLIAENTHNPELVETYYAADAYADLIARIPEIHARPKGDVLLGCVNEVVVGCAMYYPLPRPGYCEIKRIYLDQSARGLGMGRTLVEQAMRAAARDGHVRMVLDTMVALQPAIDLYLRLGFTPTEPFYQVPARFRDEIRFFGIDLPRQVPD